MNATTKDGHSFPGMKYRRVVVTRHGGPEVLQLIEEDVPEPSPGEVRKLLLAEGIQKQPVLIIMDEPTNHMDLPSIQCVEDALAACSCALLLVSHDHIFLKNVVSYFWTFRRENGLSRIFPGHKIMV